MEINTTDGLSADPVGVAIRSLHTMATGGRSDFDAVFHPDAVNRENKVQPPSSRVRGPAGFHSTALWLRAAFAGLHYEIHHALTDGDLVAVNSTMNGRHVAQFVLYRDDGEVDTAFPPTGKSFAMAQTHWFRLQDGKVSSTGRSATTWGRPSNSAGFHRALPISFRWRSPSAGSSAATAKSATVHASYADGVRALETIDAELTTSRRGAASDPLARRGARGIRQVDDPLDERACPCARPAFLPRRFSGSANFDTRFTSA